jgi:hypothetical protein
MNGTSKITNTPYEIFCEPAEQITENIEVPLLADLVARWDGYWNESTKEFLAPPIDLLEFTALLKKCTQVLDSIRNLTLDPNTDFGYIQKKDLPAGSLIFVRADIHGELKSLLENIKNMHLEGCLDENYQCCENFHIVLLGDFSDRGRYSMAVLMMVMALKIENDDNVTLIRGNHEDVCINESLAGVEDKDFTSFLQTQDTSILQDFYKALPLTCYISMQTNSGIREYVQFTHGLFEPSVDPSMLLDMNVARASMSITKGLQLIKTADNRPLSERLKEASIRIFELLEQNYIKRLGEIDLSTYMWGDIVWPTQKDDGSLDDGDSVIGDMGSRNWKLNAKDIKCFLRFYSHVHKIKMIFRGHQHAYSELRLDSKIVVCTLPVAMEQIYVGQHVEGSANQKDYSLVFLPAEKVKDWKKCFWIRNPGSSETKCSKIFTMHEYTTPEDEKERKKIDKNRARGIVKFLTLS